MKKEHASAIQSMVIEYCQKHGLVPQGNQLEVTLTITPAALVTVTVAQSDLGNVLSLNLRESLKKWQDEMELKGNRYTLLTEIVNYMVPNGTIGDFCRISESRVRYQSGVGPKIFAAISDFLTWADPRLAIGCTEEHVGPFSKKDSH